jgi:hypothetical protein
MPPVSRVLIKYVILFYFMFYEINVCFLEYVNVIISIVIFSEGRSRLSYYIIFKTHQPSTTKCMFGIIVDMPESR